MEPELNGLEIGKGEIVRQGSGTAIVNFGVMLTEAIKAGDALDATVADMRWVKPLDTALLDALAASHDVLITVEENALAGGAGSAVSEYFSECGVNCEVRHIAIDDRFIDHAGQGETRTDAGLTAEDILNKASPASARLHAQTAAVAL
jgi:1-deoxy-D-xylulose-5-phosphate synthase